MIKRPKVSSLSILIDPSLARLCELNFVHLGPCLPSHSYLHAFFLTEQMEWAHARNNEWKTLWKSRADMIKLCYVVFIDFAFESVLFAEVGTGGVDWPSHISQTFVLKLWKAARKCYNMSFVRDDWVLLSLYSNVFCFRISAAIPSLASRVYICWLFNL